MLNFENFDLLKMISLFLIFTLSSSFLYAINDYIDVESDKNHPFKKNRPFAKGLISIRDALVTISVLLFLIVIYLFFSHIENTTKLIILLYIVLGVFYSIFLKKYFLIDIITVSFFYVLRIYSGIVESNEIISNILLFIVFFFSLFILISKRFSDSKHKISIGAFTYKDKKIINYFLSINILLIFSLYLYFVFSESLILKHGDKPYYISFIFVFLSLMHYRKHTLFMKTPDPIAFFAKSNFLKINIFLWLSTIVILNNDIFSF